MHLDTATGQCVPYTRAGSRPSSLLVGLARNAWLTDMAAGSTPADVPDLAPDQYRLRQYPPPHLKSSKHPLEARTTLAGHSPVRVHQETRHRNWKNVYPNYLVRVKKIVLRLNVTIVSSGTMLNAYQAL